MARPHKTVFLKEAIGYLRVKKREKYIDATLGGGGHTEAILKLNGKVLGIDCDPEAIEAARRHLVSACPLGEKFSWRLTRGNFSNLKQIAVKEGFSRVAGVIADLGVSSHQLEEAKRGFSFNLKGPLDMRMDPDLKVTAADLVNGLNKGELNEVFKRFGQEHYSRRLADAICRTRRLKPIRTTKQLANLISQVVPERGVRQRLHPATRVFLALRIAVNDELNSLEKFLPQALALLKSRGRLVVISFHSGEDRIVKRFFRDEEKPACPSGRRACRQAGHEKTRIITKKPIRPTLKEIKQNLRSRSAKLRVLEKR